ncbi:MAG: hypothetical protein JWQ56_1730 [Pseudarthrobacter sp.]|nr:hypothetical protein [Pseudarthrobacter sp.]
MAFQFPVETGRILSFARSVGDVRDAYAAQLGAAPGSVLTVPPTFVQSGGHFDPAAALYIREAAGSGPASGGRADTLHAEQEFEYGEPLRAGDHLSAVVVDNKRWSKAGRSGGLEFTETVTEYRTQPDVLAVRARKVSVRRCAGKARYAAGPVEGEGGTAYAAGEPHAACNTHAALLVEGLRRSHIAQYAGASGDYNLVHTDEEFAVSSAGYPSVIAHGMLTMGLTATFITALIGPGTLQKLGGRFLAPVVPGDSLRCVASVYGGRPADPAGTPAGISFRTLRVADGAAVFSGRATFLPADPNTAREVALTIPKGNSS